LNVCKDRRKVIGLVELGKAMAEMAYAGEYELLRSIVSPAPGFAPRLKG
jgi:hypothetical protein